MAKKPTKPDSSPDLRYDSILGDISNLIDEARRSATRSVNCIMTAAYWLTGMRIVEFEQNGQVRAEYGEKLLERLASDLSARFGRGFSYPNLNRFRQFYLTFPVKKNLSTTLIDSESPILSTTSRELDLPLDFCFIGRQKRLRIGDEWYRVDLVFFHRRLRCLVIIDLKIGKFTHADAGQMHLYLNYARERWVHKDENPPVGLILCAQKDDAVARYALEGLPNKVMASEYRTALPDEKELAAEIKRTQAMLKGRKAISLTSSEVVRIKKTTIDTKKKKSKGRRQEKDTKKSKG